MGSNYKVVDRRRVTETGSQRNPKAPGLPAVPYKRFRDAVEGTWRHVNFHLERGLKLGSLTPTVRWVNIWGLALSTRQTYNGVLHLLADRLKPTTLPLQGAILIRSMLEVLGNIMALTANDRSIKWFLADGYRRRFEQMAALRDLFAGNDRWSAWLGEMNTVLLVEAKMIGLGARRRCRPTKTIHEWPSPYWMTRSRRPKGRKRALPALLKGNRARLFEEGYRLWYSVLSSYAHQRSAAAQMAIFANEPDAHWEPGRLESNVVSEALLFFACTMSELETAVMMPPSADLRALWALLWDLDEHAKRFVCIRYRRLLGLPALGVHSNTKPRVATARRGLAV